MATVLVPTTSSSSSSSSQRRQQQQLKSGKNAAIRQIMRERTDNKKLIQVAATASSLSLSSPSTTTTTGSTEPNKSDNNNNSNSKNNSKFERVLLHQQKENDHDDYDYDDQHQQHQDEHNLHLHTPHRTVTFDDVVYSHSIKNDDDDANDSKDEDIGTHDENYSNDLSLSSSTSSNWALLQFDATPPTTTNTTTTTAIAIATRTTSPSRVMTATFPIPPPVSSQSYCLELQSHPPQQQQQVEEDTTIDPNVSWNESTNTDTGTDTGSNHSSSNDTEVKLHTQRYDSSSKNNHSNHSDNCIDHNINNDYTDFCWNPNIVTVATTATTTTTEAGMTPFHTFRQNATCIALDETQYYIQTIQSLKQQLNAMQQENNTQRLLLQQQQHHQQLLETNPLHTDNDDTEEQNEGQQQQQHRQSVQMDNVPQQPPSTINIHTGRNFQTPTTTTTSSGSTNTNRILGSVTATTPHTRISNMTTSTTKTIETVWERNKTLVTEIRFADQTCMELSYENKLLQEQYQTLQTKYDEIQSKYETLQQENNQCKQDLQEQQQQQQQQQHENEQQPIANTSGGSATTVIDQDKNTIATLEQQLQEAQDQIGILRDEIIEKHEASVQQQETIVEQQHRIVQLKNHIQSLHDDEKNESQQQQQDKSITTTCKSANNNISGTVDNERMKVKMSDIVQTIHSQMDRFETIIQKKLSSFDKHLDHMNYTVNYIEDALLHDDDDDDDDDEDSDHSSASDSNNRNKDNIVATFSTTSHVDAASIQSIVNVTFSNHLHNETMDLAMMEEARCIRNDKENNDYDNDMDFDFLDSQLSTPDTTNVTPNKGRDHQFYFDGLSRVLSDQDFSTVVTATTVNGDGIKNFKTNRDNVDGLYNSKFMHHLQWLTATTTTTNKLPSDSHSPQHIGTSVNDPSPVSSKPFSPITVKLDYTNPFVNENLQPQGPQPRNAIVVPTQFQHGLKHIYSSNNDLSYSESDNSSSFLHHEIASCAANHHQLVTTHQNVVKETDSLYDEKSEITTLLEESIEHISKFQVIAEEHERAISEREGSLSKERNDVEKELEAVVKALDHATLSLRNSTTSSDAAATSEFPMSETSAADDNVQLREKVKALQEERDTLLSQLSATTNELSTATAKISSLQQDANTREKLMKRYKILQHEKAEADVSLREKSIVPRRLSSHAALEQNKNDELIFELNKQITVFRLEISILTQNIETLATKFDIVDAEKTKEITKLNEFITNLTMERDSIKVELHKAHQMIESLQIEKLSFQDLTVQLEAESKKLDNTINLLQERLQESQSETSGLQDQVANTEERLLACTKDLETMCVERLDLDEKIASLTRKGNQLEDEILRYELELMKSEKVVAEAKQVRLEAETTASNLKAELQRAMDQVKKMETYCNRLDDENRSLQAKLLESDKYGRLAEERRTEVESTAESVTKKLSKTIDELENTIIAKNRSDESLRQALMMQQEHENELGRIVNELLVSNERIETLEGKLNQSAQLLKNAVDENTSLRTTVDTLVIKCNKLRDYIRKITTKCQEWEDFYQRESDAIMRLHTAYKRSSQKASELSMICQEKDQKVTLLQEAHRELENDIDEIARELINISQYDDVLLDVSTNMFVQ